MRKIGLLFTVILLVIFSGTSEVHAFQPSMQIQSSDNLTLLKTGDVFNIELKLLDGNRIVGGEIEILYDSSLISLVEKSYDIVNIMDFSNLEGVNNSNLNDISGQARLIFGIDSSNPPLSGDIVIANLSFRAEGKGTGAISIKEGSKLISEDLNGNLTSISISSTPLAVNILGTGNISGVVKDKAGNPLSNTNIKLVRDSVTLYSTFASQEGNYYIDNIVEGSYILKASCDGYDEYQTNIIISEGIETTLNIVMEKTIPEDVTGDGIVSIDDLVYVANYYGLISSDSNWSEAADINKDGKIDIVDLIMVARKFD